LLADQFFDEPVLCVYVSLTYVQHTATEASSATVTLPVVDAMVVDMVAAPYAQPAATRSAALATTGATASATALAVAAAAAASVGADAGAAAAAVDAAGSTHSIVQQQVQEHRYKDPLITLATAMEHSGSSATVQHANVRLRQQQSNVHAALQGEAITSQFRGCSPSAHAMHLSNVINSCVHAVQVLCTQRSRYFRSLLLLRWINC
jgi:hypothetical protein